MNPEENKTRFLQLCRDNIKRDGIENLISWLEKSDFFYAPASTKFHGSYYGGLCQHSLNVYDEMIRLLDAYPEIECTDEELTIVTLFHDLCKVNMYTVEQRNRKNEQGKWEKYDAYAIEEKFVYGGHGSKSVFIVNNFIKLTPREAVAINCHMSCWNGDTFVGKVYEKEPFAWLLHCADESASYIVETKEQ